MVGGGDNVADRGDAEFLIDDRVLEYEARLGMTLEGACCAGGAYISCGA